MCEAKALMAGCVLAGGASRRMGMDKALLELGGKPLITLAVERFSGFQEVLISAAETERYAFTGIRIIPDERPDMGPLGGLISVLKAVDSDLVCFRPVDSPLVPAGLHLFLAEACAGHDAAVPVFQGKPEPLLACFRVSALPVLESLATKGNYKAADAFPDLDTVYLPLDEPGLVSRFGDPRDYLLNANDPETFSALKPTRPTLSASPSGRPV